MFFSFDIPLEIREKVQDELISPNKLLCYSNGCVIFDRIWPTHQTQVSRALWRMFRRVAHQVTIFGLYRRSR